MRKISYFIFLLITLTFISAGFAHLQNQMKASPGLLLYSSGDQYESLWGKVDSLEKKGLTRSLIEVLDTLYHKAQTDDNPQQLAKVLIHQVKYKSMIQEDAFMKNLNYLEGETEKAEYPLQPLLHSMMAELYWGYYQRNRWKFHQRTETQGFNNEDIRTWTLEKLIDETSKHYSKSLEPADSLKRTPAETFKPVMTDPFNSENRRPMLYDFLAHRALQFFAGEEPNITSPVYKFHIDRKKFLSSARDFTKVSLNTQDSLSLKFRAMRILRNLTEFHLEDPDPKALIDVELKRLSFVRNNGVIPGKDSLYISALEQLYEKFKQYPVASEILFERARFHTEMGTKYQPLKADRYKWERKKAMELCQKALEKYPDHYGSQECASLLKRLNEKSINVQLNYGNVPGQPFKGLLSFRNISHVYNKVVKADYEWYSKLNQNRNQSGIVAELNGKTAMRKWSLSLPDDGDLNQHNTEFPVEKLEKGFYVLMTASSSNYSVEGEAVAVTPFWVTDIGFITRRNEDGTFDFAVSNRKTGKPLQGVKAAFYQREYDYGDRRYRYNRKGSSGADENGMIRSPKVKNYSHFNVHFTMGDDKFVSNSSFYSYAYRPYEKPEISTFFYTDRAIYRPGQTVYFKGIVLKKTGDNSELKKDYETTVRFYDVNHQLVEEKSFTTNEYGSFSGSFTAPETGLNGQMHIEGKNGSRYFRVEEYKRPKFEVNFKPVKGSYKLNEEVRVEGIAKTYSGAGLDAADLKWRVVRNVSFPYWYYWRVGYYPQTEEMEIDNGMAETNADGSFEIAFKALPDPGVPETSSPMYSYTVYADITDINGETHSAQTQVYVGYEALKLNVNVPGQIRNTLVDTFHLSATNLNGQPQPTKGKVKVWKLRSPGTLFRDRNWSRPDTHLLSREEYRQLFPHDPYGNENEISNWDKGKIVLDSVFATDTTKKSKQFYFSEIGEWKPGQYLMELSAVDEFGKPVKTIRNFTVFSEKDKTMHIPSMNWFTALKDYGEPGDTASFMIGSAAKNVKIMYEVEYDDAIQQRRWIKLNNEVSKIDIPIKEEHRGNFVVHFAFVRHNRAFTYDRVITVPYTNKQLDLTFETFRNKLYPGQEEEWKIKIRGKDGDRVAAEMVATLYDASLDEFAANYWGFNAYSYYYSKKRWYGGGQNGFSTTRAQLYFVNWNDFRRMPVRKYRQLNWFGYSPVYNYYSNFAAVRSRSMTGALMQKDEASADREDIPATELVLEEAEASGEQMPEKKAKSNDKTLADGKASDMLEREEGNISGKKFTADHSLNGGESGGLQNVKARTNFSETAFFYPHLETNDSGQVLIKFTIPESLTRWKFMALAHTSDLKSGMITEEAVTQKDLMVYPNAPRFFREGDSLYFSSKINNLSEEDLEGKVQLQFFNSITMKEVSSKILSEKALREFSVAENRSTVVDWKIHIPEGYSALTYRVVAKSGNFSDGEEKPLPVLTNRMLVTESLPLPISGKGTKTYQFKKLVNNDSKTLRHHRLTLEYTSNPGWYAVQALPYMMEYPYECAEQVFSRYYANSIATHIANSNPRIKRVFETWKSSSPESFLSNLQKNEELKSLVLKETPWVLDAKDESQRKKRIGLLFDINRMSRELGKALRQLKTMQSSNGGWPWFEGLPESRYITRHIVAGIGHLEKLGIPVVKEDRSVNNMLEKAVHYLDQRILEDYLFLKRQGYDLEKNHLGQVQIHYLYARSFFKDIRFRGDTETGFAYYLQQADDYWLENNKYLQGMIALALHRFGHEEKAKEVIHSLKENAIYHEELGMYWKAKSGYYWYQAPVERQALLIEAFDEVTGDRESVDAMRVWLLKQKQTQDWKTTKATAEACYALLLQGTDWLADDTPVEITVGNLKVDPDQMDGVEREAGTGYFKTSWSGSEIKANMGNVEVTKKTEGVAWGALYWQYFEDLDKITPHKTPLKLDKKLFLEKNTDTGPIIVPIEKSKPLQPGDKLKVRIELRVDRTMNYVHMKDMRASGFEPVAVNSGPRYQDGLSYYQSTKDASTDFFFTNLAKGTYVFEYDLSVNIAGNFSNGITSIQCMYAPEFTSHSEGMRVRVQRKQ